MHFNTHLQSIPHTPALHTLLEPQQSTLQSSHSSIPSSILFSSTLQFHSHKHTYSPITDSTRLFYIPSNSHHLLFIHSTLRFTYANAFSPFALNHLPSHHASITILSNPFRNNPHSNALHTHPIPLASIPNALPSHSLSIQTNIPNRVLSSP